MTTQRKYIVQRRLDSTGDWYAIPATGHEGRPDAEWFASPNLAMDNARERVAENREGVVTKIRLIQVLAEVDISQ